MSTASPDKQSPLERIVPWLGKLSAGSAMALVTLATAQEVIAVAGQQGIPVALSALLAQVFGDVVLGPAIDRALDASPDEEGLPEGLSEKLDELSTQLEATFFQNVTQPLLEEQRAIARVTGTALSIHENRAVQRIAEAVATYTWAAKDDVVREVGGLLADVARKEDIAEVEEALRQLEQARGMTFQQTADRVGTMIAHADTVNIIQGPREPGLETLHPYLNWLHGTCMQSGLLRVLDPRSSDLRAVGKQITVEQVYTPLDTRTHVYRSEDGKVLWARQGSDPGRTERQERETTSLSAMEAADHTSRLVLLGDPGSGKSTFVNYLALCLSGHTLDLKDGWLARLEQQGWEHGPLLPVLVTLRDFAQDTLKEAEEGSAALLLGHIEHLLAKYGSPREAREVLYKALVEGRALVLLDGLDEVPQERRLVMRDTLEAFMAAYRGCRYLVTCRILSYANPDWQIEGMVAETLAPFDADKILHFVEAWYTAAEAVGSIDRDLAQQRISDLRGGLDHPHLRDVASNPMLLTVMAIVHNHTGTLPRESARLYNECVEILMLRWKPQAAAWLRDSLGITNDDDLYRILWQIAYEAHEGQAHREGAADIPVRDVMAVAAWHLNGDWQKAQRFCDYVEDRAGLLIGRGTDQRGQQVFAFPHRTFQEYLAGCHLADNQERFAELVDQKTRDGADWYEVVLFAIGHMYYNNSNRFQPIYAVEQLMIDTPANSTDWRAAWMAGRILALMGVATLRKFKRAERMLELAQERLQELIGGQYLEPIELINVALTLSTLIGLDNLGASGSNGQLPDIAGLEVGLYYESASMPSGDFFDFIPLDNGSWGIIIGDVADKGLPAILYARSCRMLLRVIAQKQDDPVEALQQLNHILLTGQSSLFVTVWMGIWRPATSTLVYAKGGHNPPFIVRAAQQEAEHLNTKGVAIGFFDGIQLDREETQLLDGDVLTLFTDGIVEASSPQDVDFGETRLEELCRSNRLLSAQAIADLIGKEVQKHTAGSKRYDDAIAIVLRRV